MSTALSTSAWEQAAEAGNLSEAIRLYVEDRDWVSFAELGNRLGQHFDLKGSLALVGSDRNLVFWAGMSELFLDAVQTLVRSGAVVIYPVEYLVYLIDGEALRLPVAKRPPKDGYTTEHWLPVCLRPRSARGAA